MSIFAVIPRPISVTVSVRNAPHNIIRTSTSMGDVPLAQPGRCGRSVKKIRWDIREEGDGNGWLKSAPGRANEGQEEVGR